MDFIKMKENVETRKKELLEKIDSFLEKENTKKTCLSNIQAELERIFNEVIMTEDKKNKIKLKDTDLSGNTLEFSISFQSIEKESEKLFHEYWYKTFLKLKENRIQIVLNDFFFDNKDDKSMGILMFLNNIVSKLNKKELITEPILKEVNCFQEISESKQILKNTIKEDIHMLDKEITKYNKTYFEEKLFKIGNTFTTDSDIEVFGIQTICESNEKFMNDENMSDINEKTIEIKSFDNTGEVKGIVKEDDREWFTHKIFLRDYYLRKLIVFENDESFVDSIKHDIEPSRIDFVKSKMPFIFRY